MSYEEVESSGQTREGLAWKAGGSCSRTREFWSDMTSGLFV